MPDGRHYAILIGSSQFNPKSGLKDLRCPEQDVDGMAALLTSAEYGLFAANDIQAFKNQPHYEILPEINAIFKQARPEDLILLYYSGHGELDNKDRLHLATPDSRKDVIETTSIRTSILRDLIDNHRCKRVVMILDCCYSGAIKRDLLRSSLDNQVNQLAKGIYILTASTELQTAEEKEGDDYGLLTKHILQGIRQGKVPSDAHGNISISALQRYVSVAVPRDGAQEPTGYGLDERGGELIIARAAQAYDAQRLRAFRTLISELENNEEIEDELADQVRAVIRGNQPKRDKALFDLLDQLYKQRIKPGRFSTQWLKLFAVSPINQEKGQKKEKPAQPRVVVTPRATRAMAPAKQETIVSGAGFTEDLKGVKLEMVYVPGGKFTMGSSDKRDDEKPPHPVTVPNFYMGKFQITQAQWQAVMGKNPSHFKGDDLPVENVSWDAAQEFCQKLSQLTQKAYRLPTEAEWEYACRAGTTGDYAGKLDEMGWYAENSGKKTHPVGKKQANAFGLYDMHGNVWEWCEDVWHDNYDSAPDDGSAWVKGGDQKRRVMRGGSWFGNANYCRSASRFNDQPAIYYINIGVRVVVSARTL
jgi:formylglycine-generating enzyme required for sulfatase activity